MRKDKQNITEFWRPKGTCLTLANLGTTRSTQEVEEKEKQYDRRTKHMACVTRNKRLVGKASVFARGEGKLDSVV